MWAFLVIHLCEIPDTTLILAVAHCSAESENFKSCAFYKLTTSLEWKRTKMQGQKRRNTALINFILDASQRTLVTIRISLRWSGPCQRFLYRSCLFKKLPHAPLRTSRKFRFKLRGEVSSFRHSILLSVRLYCSIHLYS